MFTYALKTGTSLLTHNISVRNSSKLSCALKNAKIIPDVICKAPKHKATVCFKDAKAKLGNVIMPKCTECPPKVTWKKPCGRFCVIMLDPDMESKKCPELRHWVHWLVGNIKDDKVSKGETLMEYIAAVPGEGTCKHRIVILVYKQQNKVDFCMKKICKDTACGREKFDLKAFTKKYELCEPIAINFFETESDKFSEKLRKKLREKSCC